jgi:hypothetical protein
VSRHIGRIAAPQPCQPLLRQQAAEGGEELVTCYLACRANEATGRTRGRVRWWQVGVTGAGAKSRQWGRESGSVCSMCRGSRLLLLAWPVRTAIAVQSLAGEAGVLSCQAGMPCDRIPQRLFCPFVVVPPLRPTHHVGWLGWRPAFG